MNVSSYSSAMPGSVTAQALRDFMAFVDLGTSLLIATRDANKRCEITRAGAARLVDRRIQLLIPMPEGERSLGNIADNHDIALTAAHPTSYRSFQIKGRDAELTIWPDMQAAAERHVAGFAAEVVQLGLPLERANHFWSRLFVAVIFTPDALFEQTPGPGAGRRIMGPV
jgi:hypothetical protein